MKYRIVAILVLVLAQSAAFAQWKLLAPNLLPTANRFAGHYPMTYKAGIVWIVADKVYMSVDSGKTWISPTLFGVPFGAGWVDDVDFYDRSNGIVAGENGTYITNDQGVTWQSVLGFNSSFSACYGSSSEILASNSFASTGSSGSIAAQISTDGGSTWGGVLPGTYSKLTAGKNGELLAMGVGGGATFAQVFETTNLGVNWATAGGVVFPDSWGFAIDSCDPALRYIINENYYNPIGSSASVFRSRDGGTTWLATIDRPLPFFCGSIALTNDAVYCQTIVDGVYRSTDRGETWNSIGGPSNIPDSRSLAAINDNILLATDSLGNVWGTTNSGGDSVIDVIGSSSVMVVPQSVHFQDTLALCSPASSQKVWVAGGCVRPTIVSYVLNGRDSNYFLARSDSFLNAVTLFFSPDSSRNYAVNLTLTLSDGNVVAVPVTALASSPLQLALSTDSLYDDTVGGTVYVPIIVHPPALSGTLDLTLQFDTAMLVYQGAYGMKDSQTDVTTQRSSGSVRLHFDQTTIQKSDTIVGYAAFLIYPTSTNCTTVGFDSISIEDGTGLTCTSINKNVAAPICSASACGTTELSNLLRYDRMPHLTIAPNPVSAVARIVTDRDLGEVTIQVFDALGQLRAGDVQLLNRSHSAAISVSELGSGPYAVRVLSSIYSGNYRLIVLK